MAPIAIFLVIWSKLLSEQESGESIVTGVHVVHLTEEAPMVSIPKVVGVLSCGFLLCLGLSNAVQAEHSPGASDVMKTDSVTDKQGFQSDDDKQKNVDNEKGSNRPDGAKTIKGELTRVEDGNYFVKVKDGKEVRLHTDKTTEMMGEIKKGDRIEAKVNDQNHALSIHSAK
ncbi:MAG: hypothetical protein E8D49_14630 [Nitrospira sp.]|nr:MAG: hypothetical protein E8D49_14630 [Nitrospira sp.]